MTAIWLLSTRGRPKEAQETINACLNTGMTSEGVVYVDDDTGLYDDLWLPTNWTVHREPEWRSLQGSMQWCYTNFPDRSCYGWLADDTRPRTEGWDKQLENAAGNWCLSYAKDLWLSENPTFLDRLRKGHDLSSGLCWGGKLVRTVGWWALPGVTQAGIDTVWNQLTSPLMLHRYVDDVTVEHLNWRTGKREKDPIDCWERDGDTYIERDIIYAAEWVQSPAFADTLTMIATAVGLNLDSPPLVYALTKNTLDQRLSETGGVKNADIVLLQQLERAANAYQRLHPYL